MNRVLIEEIPSETPGLPRKPFPKVHADGQKLEAYKGPGTFARTVAARQLAWCVLRLGYKQIEEGYAPSCPGGAACNIGVAEGHAAVCVAKRSILGCNARVWNAAAPTATALVRSLCGTEAFSQGYSTIMAEMQGERFAHQLNHRLVWLKAMPSLIQGMGLATVR
ncbi:hypothetical protein WJX73_001562 [Symbiochloris irregularis]|uniref:Uncharacterized protein n=1 Tax=Symbiochloris irregularis TaxID=706552 RepID=A0AAW1NY37_9CHLO